MTLEEMGDLMSRITSEPGVPIVDAPIDDFRNQNRGALLLRALKDRQLSALYRSEAMSAQEQLFRVTAERDRLREALDSARRGFRVIKRICDEARNDKSKIDDIRYAVRIEMEESDV